MRAGTFIGLVLVFPCPWYMVAVGGLLPLPVILLYGFSGGIVLVFSLVHVALYTWVFDRVARWAGSIVRTGRVQGHVAALLLLSILLALSFLPIYIEGENLASGYRPGRNAYEAYRDAYYDVFRGGRPIPIPPELAPQPTR